MGHASTQNMIKALNSGTWIVENITADDIRQAMQVKPCIICEMSKRNRTGTPDSITDPRNVPIGHLVSGDIIGPIAPTSNDVHQYFSLFVDRATSYTHVYTSASKSFLSHH